MLIKKEMDPEKEKQIDKLKDDLIELQTTVSEMRKKGRETSIPELLLLEIPARIKNAEITGEQKDIDKIKKGIDSIKEEIEEIEKGSDFDHIYDLIRSAFENIRQDKIKKAKEEYNQMINIYRMLPKDLKKTVISACEELRRRLSR